MRNSPVSKRWYPRAAPFLDAILYAPFFFMKNSGRPLGRNATPFGLSPGLCGPRDLIPSHLGYNKVLFWGIFRPFSVTSS